MKIILTEGFQRDVASLSGQGQQQIHAVLLKLPNALKDVHRHTGLGLRKIHKTGIFEARVGLGIRIVFGFKEDALTLHRVGNHDDIQRYLRKL